MGNPKHIPHGAGLIQKTVFSLKPKSLVLPAPLHHTVLHQTPKNSTSNNNTRSTHSPMVCKYTSVYCQDEKGRSCSDSFYDAASLRGIRMKTFKHLLTEVSDLVRREELLPSVLGVWL